MYSNSGHARKSEIVIKMVGILLGGDEKIDWRIGLA
jgi:hypothetical protein